MKKFLGFFLFCSFIFIYGCGNNTIIEENQNTEVNTGNEVKQESSNNLTLEDTILAYIANKYNCNDGSKLFVNYAELGQNNADFYINAIGEGFYIDERGNLNNSCGFSIPMKVTVSTEDGANYVVTNAVQARDGNEYEKSLKEMFSNEAIDILNNGNLRFLDGRTLLEMAEEYFRVTIIPEEKNNFECGFCDKTWYELSNNNENYETNDLIFNYTAENNGHNTIYFNSDGSFEDNTNRELSGKGTWTWGIDANTIIVEKENVPVYFRYIITNQTNNSLGTILEIIQKG